MKYLTTLVFAILALVSKGTEQRFDKLIFGKDTIYIDCFPLEILVEKDSLIDSHLNDKNCLASDCWREYVAIWKIENDSLFLIGLKDCCYENEIPISRIFPSSKISNGKVFASWYSGQIKAGYGKWLRFDENNWKHIYENEIDVEISSGELSHLEKEQTLKD